MFIHGGLFVKECLLSVIVIILNTEDSLRVRGPLMDAGLYVSVFLRAM